MKPSFGAHAHYPLKSRNQEKAPLSKAFNDLVTSRLFEKANTQYTIAAMDSNNTHHLLNGPEADMFMAITYAKEVLERALKAKEANRPTATTPKIREALKVASIQDITKIVQGAYAGLLQLPGQAFIIDADIKSADTPPPAQPKWLSFLRG